MKAEAIIKIRFLNPDEGGRKNAIESGKFSCPLIIDEKAFDCRFEIEPGSRILLGETIEIPVQFRDPDSALKLLFVGKTITLWDGG